MTIIDINGEYCYHCQYEQLGTALIDEPILIPALGSDSFGCAAKFGDPVPIRSDASKG
jgi:hypothetical protein